jgi:hypothetical protein
MRDVSVGSEKERMQWGGLLLTKVGVDDDFSHRRSFPGASHLYWHRMAG